MKKLAMALLLVASAVNAQPPDVPGKTMPPAVPSVAAQAPSEVTPPSEPATLLVTNLPQNAVVWIDGERANITGNTRRFVTPPLPAGTWVYDLKISANGIEYHTKIKARAGYTTPLDMGNYFAAVRQVSPMASPFPLPAPSSGADRKPGQPTADGNNEAASLWPRGFPKPLGLVRYQRARFTQAIATTNGSPSIDAVDRRAQLRKWQVPGGLEHVEGWSSTLYKFQPRDGKAWKERIPVWNGGFWSANYGYGWVTTDKKAMQNELGLRRSYPDGTLFVDVLSHRGKVFEVRYAEKQRGSWDRFIAFKDVAARPIGYHPPSRSECRECHSQTGTGGYATGLVPGGDTVISDPFGSLE